MKDRCEVNLGGWLWPVEDTKTFDFLWTEREIPEWIMGFVPVKGVCVQAGGNCGFYVEQYAKAFGAVYTFEPHALNFRCLVHNVPHENVLFYRAALGGQPSMVTMNGDPDSLGAMQAAPVDEGIIPTLELDCFGLPRVDLVHLDVEGGEIRALTGARNTIDRCRPVIALEINGRCEQFGLTHEEVVEWMGRIRYRHAAQRFNDHVFLPEEKNDV